MPEPSWEVQDPDQARTSDLYYLWVSLIVLTGETEATRANGRENVYPFCPVIFGVVQGEGRTWEEQLKS